MRHTVKLNAMEFEQKQKQTESKRSLRHNQEIGKNNC